MKRTLPIAALAVLLEAALVAQAPSGKEGVPIRSRSTVVDVAPGAVLRTRPTVAAPVVTVVDEPVAAELVEERAGWRRLRFGTVSGWLAPEGVERAGAPAWFEIDRERLDRTLALLPPAAVERTVSGVALRAPADAAPRMERWETVTRQAIASWPGRLGVESVELDGATVVFAPGEPEAVSAYEAPGSAGGGVALLQLAERSDDEIEALLVHELSHLASERTFPRGLPIWLEEGIAEWLAREALGSDGYSLPGTLRGEVSVEQEGRRRRVDVSGPLADLVRLAREAKEGSLPALERWSALPEAEFATAAARSANYALAGSFVRFLFEAEETRAAIVREVLAGAAAGALDVDAELDRRLGDVGELDRAFRAWLIEELDRQIVPEMR